MASSTGLTRRRGARGGTEGGDDTRGPSPSGQLNGDSRVPETSYTDGENGHKIAFDPRDLSESEERSKQPKLTLMEEVLLLGLKDKQVKEGTNLLFFGWLMNTSADYGGYHPGLPVILE